MSAKIQIKSDLVGTFGGIFLMLDHFGKANLDKLINKSLGDRRFNAKYSYSDIFKTLLATYASNGSCIEDSRRISGQISEKSQDYRLCSPDILLNSFKELCTESSASHSESGIEYRFNHNPALTSLAVKGLIQCGQVDTKTAHVFDCMNNDFGCHRPKGGNMCQDVTDRREVTFSKMGPPAMFLHGDEYRVHGHHGLSAQLLQAFPLHP